MKPIRWLLVFPPLVTSNWGSYYPATAVLAAVLRQHGSVADQLDLNEAFFDYMVDSNRVAEATARLSSNCTVDPALIPQQTALQVIHQRRARIRDKQGRHFTVEPGNDVDLAVELARPYHVDMDLPYLFSEEFLNSEVARTYDHFFQMSQLSEYLDTDVHAIGISVPMGPQIAPSIILAKLIKRMRPDIRIIVGGPSFTLMGRENLDRVLADSKAVDAIVQFEGEAPILALSRQLAEGCWNPYAIPGVFSNKVESRLKMPPARVRDLPFAHYAPELVEVLAAPRFSVLQARGCYWGRCAYCDFIELYSGSSRYDGRKATGVIDELVHLQELHDAKAFWLVTEALPVKVGLRFAETLLDRGLKVDWRSFAMVDRGFTPDVLEKFVASGCTSLTIGLETMANRVLTLVGKYARCDDNLRFLQACRQAGLQIDLNLIPNLPTTTFEEAVVSLRLLMPYADVFRTVAVFPFEATVSSAIGRQPDKYGMTVVGHGESQDVLFPKGQAQYASNRLTYQDDGMSVEELQRVMEMYNTFATVIRVGQQANQRREGRGLAFRSHRVGVLSTDQETIVYEWDRDKAWRFHAGAYPLLSWMQSQNRPVSRGEMATWLATQYGSRHAPTACHDICNQLVGLGVVDDLC